MDGYTFGSVLTVAISIVALAAMGKRIDWKSARGTTVSIRKEESQAVELPREGEGF